MLEQICAIAFIILTLCAYTALRSALRRRRAPAAAPAADPHERVLSLLHSGRRIAAVQEARKLTGGSVADAVEYVERLESGSNR